MKKVLLGLAFLSLAGIANASTTSDIPLPIANGTVAPKGGMLTVSLSPLLLNVPYTVGCTITNNSNSTVGMVFNSSMTGFVASFTLNGNPVSGYGSAYVKPGSNSLVTSTLNVSSNNGVLSFENTDNTNSVTVSNCVAHFVGSAK